jgi:hypothetical protein
MSFRCIKLFAEPGCAASWVAPQGSERIIEHAGPRNPAIEINHSFVIYSFE